MRGETTVILGPTESLVGKGKTDAVEIDKETAVIVRSKRSGELELVSALDGSGERLFFPKPETDILEVQKLIKLADYECMIIKNAQGELSFYYGAEEKRGGKPRAFFIPPHHAVNALTWSRGRRRDRRDLKIECLDCRPQFMSFEFTCRTSDNVELVLEGTFFWQIVDVERMVKMTGDTSGDVCNHARSKFIQLVSKVTLKTFMDDFNALATQAHQSDDEFYTCRGVAIHTLEVTAYRCQDASTAQILEQIIQVCVCRGVFVQFVACVGAGILHVGRVERGGRVGGWGRVRECICVPSRASERACVPVSLPFTLLSPLSLCYLFSSYLPPVTRHMVSAHRQETTNRMNRLSQQESENEVKMFAMNGEIEQETRRADLLKVLQTHKLMEARNDGEAEAERVKAFLTQTEASVPALDARMRLWNVLRKQDALQAVSSGPARLYFTPNDVNLTIESKDTD